MVEVPKYCSQNSIRVHLLSTIEKLKAHNHDLASRQTLEIAL